MGCRGHAYGLGGGVSTSSPWPPSPGQEKGARGGTLRPRTTTRPAYNAATVRLHVGKKNQGNTSPVQSIFRLAGSDEDALTFALGFLLAHGRSFCAKLIRHLGVTPRRRLKPGYSIHLQEVTGKGFGRRDVVIQDDSMRIVLEAKIGGAEPTAEQLLTYGAERELWRKYKTRGVVALTQVPLAEATRKEVEKNLSESGWEIQFGNVQWHTVVDLALSHRPSDDSEVSRYLFDQFILFVRRDYSMNYYDAEILIQDVNSLNAKIFEEGWMYVTVLQDKKAPLYFAPYFTEEVQNSGISRISRVQRTESVLLADKQDVVEYPPSEEHRKRWRRGLHLIYKRAEKENWGRKENRLFFLDSPITLWTPPITKKAFNGTRPSKQIPNQIPKGFSLTFHELLEYSHSPNK